MARRSLLSRFLAVFVAAVFVPSLAVPADPLRGGWITAPAYATDTPSYVVSFTVAPTVAMDVITISGSAALNKVTRLRRIVLVNPGSATAAATVDLALGVAPTGGSGGANTTGNPVDQGVRPAGVTGGPDSSINNMAAIGNTTEAGSFVALYSPLATVTVPAAAGGFTPLVLYDSREPRFKPLTVTSLTGETAIILRIPAVGAGAANFRGHAEFTVTDS